MREKRSTASKEQTRRGHRKRERLEHLLSHKLTMVESKVV